MRLTLGMAVFSFSSGKRSLADAMAETKSSAFQRKELARALTVNTASVKG